MNAFVDGVTYLLVDPQTSSGGVYHGDTRHLSTLSVTVDDVDLHALDETPYRPSRRVCRYADVGSSINEVTDAVDGKQATTVLERRQEVTEGLFAETVTVHNCSSRTRTPTVDVEFGVDFADIFEVRGLDDGVERDVDADADARSVTYAYTARAGEVGEHEPNPGAEGTAPRADSGETTPRADSRETTPRPDSEGAITLETAVRFDAAPQSLRPGRARFEPTLQSQESWTVSVEVVPGGDVSTVHRAGERVDPFVVDGAVETGNDDYDRTFAQARRDVRALTTNTDHGLVPLAGAPWFVTVFGRDSLLTAHQLVSFAPDLARGTLRYLAAHQGTETDECSDEAPGKILHEVRRGELARFASVPETCFYGTVDATPLWVVLLHELWRWTDDDGVVEELWPNLTAALEWIDRTVAAVGDDPFLHYESFGTSGVVHKTWRDSATGVQFADGTQVTPPLASAAVQGFVYDAYTRAAELSSAVRGDEGFASDRRQRARDLQDRFDDAFWMADRDHYATALTAEGDPVDSATSNMGHCLWSGIVPSHRAASVADRLLAPDMFSGWGVRTTSADEAGYSPVSYHAGSVWPHDNVIAAQGLARYDLHDAAQSVALAQLDAYSQLDGNAIPELFCGFDDSRPPVPYPSACRPQAWAAAAPFGLLEALFGLEPGDGRGPVLGHDPERLSRDALAGVLDHWR